MLMEHLEPKAPLKFFEEISAIPRSSKEEAAIADYLVRFAEARNLPFYRDEIHNVIIKKDGTSGYEEHDPVMLQGHTDMVCEQNAGTNHDFSKEGIHLILEENMLRADGTTLGGDNGVAVACMLALLDATDLSHPPLECVFTAQEEIGLFGAAKLDGSQLKSRKMINLDGEPFGHAIISCAGGMRVIFRHKIERSPLKSSYTLQISVRGLIGGHSGNDIARERGNAIKILGRVLLHLSKKSPVQLCSIQGGAKDNAIPRESDCVLAFQEEASCRKAEDLIAGLEKEIQTELAGTDPGLHISVKPISEIKESFSPELSQKVIELINLAPNGVLTRSLSEGGFVVSSVNLGVIREADGDIRLTFAPRSSVQSLQDETAAKLDLLSRLFGFEAEFGSDYPGWSYVPVSPLREEFQRSFRELFGADLQMEAIHAGLECGLFAAKLPGLDAIALGPNLHDIHTPNEKLDIDSYNKFWKLIKTVLTRL